MVAGRQGVVPASCVCLCKWKVERYRDTKLQRVHRDMHLHTHAHRDIHGRKFTVRYKYECAQKVEVR